MFAREDMESAESWPDFPLGFFYDYRKLPGIGIGYAGVIYCHSCALEYGARQFAGHRGWCYVDGNANDGPAHELRLYVEGLGDTSADAIIDEIAELMNLTGSVLEQSPDCAGLWAIVDVDEDDRKKWADLYEAAHKGCIDIHDEPEEPP